MSFFTDVGEFHRAFDLPHSADGKPPTALTSDDLAFRIAFMMEELTEFTRAASQHDLAGMLDALVDLVYVACGTAHLKRLPFDEAWAAVHAANMRKVRAESADDPRSKRGHSLDVVKPIGWVAPDIEEIIWRRRIEVLGPELTDKLYNVKMEIDQP